MRKVVSLCCTVFFCAQLFSQITLTELPSGGNKKAMVGEQIGLTNVVIHYDRPGVKQREGRIWGTQIVHKGFADLQFGSSKAAPWRAGANENTTIEFSNDVKIEGQPLKAGKYGFFIAYDSAQSTVIFSKNTNAWGSYFYDQKADALRVTVKPVKLANSVEWLKYEFSDQTENAATVGLYWEKLMIPFRVETDYVQDQLTSFRNELQSSRGFSWMAWDEAARWSLQHNINLDEALQWSETATGPNFGGAVVFQPNATKADILAKLGRNDESMAVMKKAMPLATMQELNSYGRSLLNQKKYSEAMEVFKTNYQKNPNQYVSAVGMARGYSAMKDYKGALKYAEIALPLAPSEANKKFVSESIEKLKKGTDMN